MDLKTKIGLICGRNKPYGEKRMGEKEEEEEEEKKKFKQGQKGMETKLKYGIAWIL